MNQEKIGLFIQENRKKKKLTQEELAELLGVSKNAVSKWERGICLMDMSLLEPLSKILDISINEILAGEKINDNSIENVANNNILNTINYSSKKINNLRNNIGIILLVIGFLIVLTAVVIFPEESSWSSIYSVIGLIIGLIGFANFTRKLKYYKRLIFNYAFFMIMFLFLLLLDFLNVYLNSEVPMFSLETITIDNTIFYNTPFYDVIKCNRNEDKEKLIILSNNNYDTSFIMNYCEK